MNAGSERRLRLLEKARGAGRTIMLADMRCIDASFDIDAAIEQRRRETGLIDGGEIILFSWFPIGPAQAEAMNQETEWERRYGTPRSRRRFFLWSDNARVSAFDQEGEKARFRRERGLPANAEIVVVGKERSASGVRA